MRFLAAGLMLVGLPVAVLGPLAVGTLDAGPPEHRIEHIDLMIAGGASLFLFGLLLLALSMLMQQG